ncbi:cytochrome C [Kineobactrum sediminis]|uniref:Cytochrome C n=1 Tax=Kineobactrum sediminis TaxID=1905677 RepID=A0A2N5Y1D5_9GAMM|nr:c-type cytochrome [Kineobactrum sediminis]PLW82169.1 cytochrome C [Kineobactrum sediminis]
MKAAVTVSIIFITGLCYYAMSSNNPDWSGNGNRCVGDCYESWLAENGSVVQQEKIKQIAAASSSPAELGETYYAQCIGCHGAQGGGGIGPALTGDITSKLEAYRAGETRGKQSMLMWSVAKPMTDSDINNLAAYVKTF